MHFSKSEFLIVFLTFSTRLNIHSLPTSLAVADSASSGDTEELSTESKVAATILTITEELLPVVDSTNIKVQNTTAIVVQKTLPQTIQPTLLVKKTPIKTKKLVMLSEAQQTENSKNYFLKASGKLNLKVFCKKK